MTALPMNAPSGAARLPVVGFIARDIARDINVVFYLLTIFVTLVVLAVKTWGVVALASGAVRALRGTG